MGVAGRADVRVDLLHTDPGVGDAAVVGDDQPVHAVPGALADLVDDAVLAVAAVLGVDVVVAGQPEEAPLAARPLPAACAGAAVAVPVWARTVPAASPAPSRPRAAQRPRALLFGAQGLVGDAGAVKAAGRGCAASWSWSWVCACPWWCWPCACPCPCPMKILLDTAACAAVRKIEAEDANV